MYICVGLGVDEKSLIAVMGKWQLEERRSFRKGTHSFFVEDERSFERVDVDWVKRLKKEFLRFHVIYYYIFLISMYFIIILKILL